MTNTTYLTDRNGFPMIACERCLGEGVLRQHGAIMDGVCFSCKGRKGHYPAGRAGNVARKFYADSAASRKKISAAELVAGMTVLYSGSRRWVTVVDITPAGSYVDVTFKGGSVQSFDPACTFLLPPTFTPEEIASAAAKSRALYEAGTR